MKRRTALALGQREKRVLNDQGSRRLPLVLLLLAGVLTISGVALGLATGGFRDKGPAVPIFFVGILGIAALGTLIVRRHSRHLIGWILITAGLASGSQAFTFAYSQFTLAIRPGVLPGGAMAAWIGDVVWLPALALGLTFLFLYFPDGRLPSPKWLPVARLAVVATVMAALPVALEKTLYAFPKIRAPLAWVAIPKGVIDLLGGLGFLAWVAATLLAFASLVVRFRRSQTEHRQQIKWVMFAAAITLAIELPAAFFEPDSLFFSLISAFVGLLVPVAVAVAILRYRLYDIDLIINKTLVFGLLAAIITLMYVGIVVGVGGLVSVLTDTHLGPALQVAATTAVALAFQPAKSRLQRLANRVVYGKRATPYEVMSELSHRMAGAISQDEVLPGIAETAANGVHAARAQVTVLLPGGNRRIVNYPADSANADWDHMIPVTYVGEVVGEIAVALTSGEHLTSADTKLLEDFASQAGVVLHNLRLDAELQARLDEITAQAAELTVSSQRIVAAQNEERRRLEHAIHRGPQEQLSAMQMRIGDAEVKLDDDPVGAVGLLEDLAAQAKATLETLRDLARGIFPPLLADKGLLFALEAQASKSAFPVKVLAAPELKTSRFDQKTEATVYFCCVEALAAAETRQSPVTISLRLGDGFLIFEIALDGQRFDTTTDGAIDVQNMSDRVEALGGNLQVLSTLLRGLVPAQVLVEA